VWINPPQQKVEQKQGKLITRIKVGMHQYKSLKKLHWLLYGGENKLSRVLE
jgi:hypothetical protein